jgi:hypothetical protein
MISGLLLSMVLSVCTCWFHNVVAFPSWLVSTDCTCQCLLSNFTPVCYYYYYYYFSVNLFLLDNHVSFLILFFYCYNCIIYCVFISYFWAYLRVLAFCKLFYLRNTLIKPVNCYNCCEYFYCFFTISLEINHLLWH